MTWKEYSSVLDLLSSKLSFRLESEIGFKIQVFAQEGWI